MLLARLLANHHSALSRGEMKGGVHIALESAAAVLLLSPAAGLMYDVLEPLKLPPVECGSAGCMRWDDHSALTVRGWMNYCTQSAAGGVCLRGH